MSRRIVLSALVLLACCNADAGNSLTSTERAKQALSASPVRDAIYIDIPAAGNPVANWMLGSVVGSATWMDQLKAAMALGAESPTNLIVGGENEGVIRKAVQAAMKSFRGRRLPQLTLTVLGTSAKAESLRAQAESLGINYVVQKPGLPR
jgi:hypothetical protein